MISYLTTLKLIIALLAVLAVGFAIHSVGKAQSTSERYSDLSAADPRLIHEVDAVPTEPGELEPGISARIQADPPDPSRLSATPPVRPALLANYPNPFNPETWIPYQLAEAAEVKVSIYTTGGRLIRTLALGPQVPGVYRSKGRAAYWDGRNEVGERVGSGVYFYTLEAGSFRATRKMLILK